MSDHALRPWQLSFLFHGLLAVLFLLLTKVPSRKEVINIPLEINIPQKTQVLEKKESKPQVVLKSVNTRPQIEESKPARQVFGASRDSYTDEKVDSSVAVAAKKGNTLAKEVDQEVLTDEDPTSLPTPTEEYLVSEMPSVLSEVKPVYPREARNERVEGAVEMDILIDSQGAVRQVVVVEGPEVFRSVAIEAMKKFKFRPARVDGNPVAVKIRYTLRFELEY